MTNSVESQEKGEKNWSYCQRYKWSLEWTHLRLRKENWFTRAGRNFQQLLYRGKARPGWWQNTCQLCLARTCKSHLQPLKSAQFSKVTWQFDVRIEFLSRCFPFFWQKCLYTAELASASCNTQDRIQLEALISLYERDKTKNQVKTTAGAVSV